MFMLPVNAMKVVKMLILTVSAYMYGKHKAMLKV